MTTRTLTSTLRIIVPHLAAALVILGCVRLAVWQLDRAEYKRTLGEQWLNAPALSFDEAADGAAPQYSRIEGSGRFDAERQVFLDNQIRLNHSGVHVFTPFIPASGKALYLVNRGWQPWDRQSGSWPEFPTPAGTITLSGRLSGPPRVGLQLGEAAPLDPDDWPNLMTYFDLERLSEAFGADLAGQIILLDPDHPAHLTGDQWQLINMGPERHTGYAFQWASIGLAVFVIWLVLTIRSRRRA
ncbi:MAG: SURF1 family protein [Wenzhouxiangella sp.]|nr:SURF1 family protein [Wenzhouxiangella sp.]